MAKKGFGFVVYDSWVKTINELPINLRWPTFEVLANYALNGENPDFSNLTREQRIIVLMAVPQIDSNAKKRAYGMRGGRPTTTNTSNGVSALKTHPSALYVPPDELKRLQMQEALNQSRCRVTD